MPLDPEYTLPYQAGVRDHNYVYGTEYESPMQDSPDHNVPYAVCYVTTRETVLMIPAKAMAAAQPPGQGSTMDTS